MTADTLARLTRVLAHHSETLQIISKQLAELAHEYALLSIELADLHTQPQIINQTIETKDPPVLRSAEAAEYLGLKKQTLAMYRLKGGGPQYIRLGQGQRSPVAYRKEDLDSWLESKRFRSTSHESTEDS